jgi:hypothetical protein
MPPLEKPKDLHGGFYKADPGNPDEKLYPPDYRFL